jgi:sigma-B regulation protein RsbU (phosphoserine phosphatase)
MRIRIPLFFKVMAPLVALILLIVSWSGYRVYQESTRRWQSEMDTRLERIATLVAGTVNGETLRLVRQPVDIDGPAFLEIQEQLDQAQTAGNLSWVGIYYRDGDDFFYWVDTDSTGVGYPFFYATPEHFAAYEDRKPHRVRYADEFGSYYGFVAPVVVTDEAGEPHVVGLVEAVLVEEATQLVRRDTLNRVLPILVGGSLAAIGLSLLVTNVVFNRPLRRVQQGALTLASGRLGHTIEWASYDELGDLARAFNQMSTQLEELYHERAEHERLQRELEIARGVQQALFPAQLPQIAGLEIAAFCRPHRETSGDFYQLLALGEGQLGVVVGDVSGKSIPAAMVMVAAHSAIGAEANDHPSPGQVLNEANLALCRNMPRGMFVAASYARLDVASGELRWANAGQLYPLLVHRPHPIDSQEELRYLETPGTAVPLGMHPAASYDDQRLALAPGDTLVFYTDGVVEAMNPARELYGFERLEARIRSSRSGSSPQALIEAVLADVTRFIGSAELHDDLTLVVVKLAGARPG